MKDVLISFETAKLAKEKGLTEGMCVDAVYGIGYGIIPEDRKITPHSYLRSSVKDQLHLALAPTQALLQKWLREVHNIHIYIIPDYKSRNNEKKIIWIYDLEFLNPIKEYGSPTKKEYNSFEEALEIGLQEALKLIPNS